MGVRILADVEEGLACLYCSVSDTAFGPVFYGGRHEAQVFLDWLGDGKDPRTMTARELESHYTDFRAEQEADEEAEV